MSDRKRFHPIALISYFIKTFYGLIFIVVLALFNLDSNPLIPLLIILGVIIVSLIVSLFKHYTHTYIINENKIVIYKGLFVKRETEIPYERIQTIQQRQWFFYKPFNVVQILIETGSTSDNEAEASLLAVDESLIDLIEEYRHKRLNGSQSDKSKPLDKGNIQDSYSDTNDSDFSFSDSFVNLDNKDKIEDEEVIYTYKMSNTDIFLFALTDLNIILVLLTVVVFIQTLFTEYSFIIDRIPKDFFDSIDNFLAQSIWLVVSILIITSIGFLIIFSLIKNFLYYFEFTVTCSKKTITIEYGVFERKTQKFPISKIQGIKVYQQSIRRLFKMSSVEIIIVGGQEKAGENSIEKKLFLLPLIKTDKMYQAFQEIFPDYTIEDPEINYVGRGKLFYFWRWIIIIFLPMIIVAFFLYTWLGIIILLIGSVFILFNWFDYRYQGYAILDKNLLVIQNFVGISKVQTYVDRSKIQSFTKHSSILLLRKNIGNFEFFIKFGMIPLPVRLRYVDLKDINIVQNFIINRDYIARD